MTARNVLLVDYEIHHATVDGEVSQAWSDAVTARNVLLVDYEIHHATVDGEVSQAWSDAAEAVTRKDAYALLRAAEKMRNALDEKLRRALDAVE